MRNTRPARKTDAMTTLLWPGDERPVELLGAELLGAGVLA
jgi:hypothetical protein